MNPALGSKKKHWDKHKYKNQNPIYVQPSGLEFLEDPTTFLNDGDIISRKRPVAFYTYDFGWLLKGNAGKEFMTYLRNQRNDSSIFQLKTI